MVRIDGLIFGYRHIKVEARDVAEAASLLLRAKINARISPDGVLVLRERDANKMRDLFCGKIAYSESPVWGVLGKIKSIKHKVGLITALIFSAFLLILS